MNWASDFELHLKSEGKVTLSIADVHKFVYLLLFYKLNITTSDAFDRFHGIFQ